MGGYTCSSSAYFCELGCSCVFGTRGLNFHGPTSTKTCWQTFGRARNLSRYGSKTRMGGRITNQRPSFCHETSSFWPLCLSVRYNDIAYATRFRSGSRPESRIRVRICASSRSCSNSSSLPSIPHIWICQAILSAAGVTSESRTA